ncbi:MAG: LptF/LptG family permease [Cytophagaceae bacterium]|nr:LptF/LptG family permease [Cytophagaceae bacterium]
MKRLDKLIIGAFLGPFFLTFSVVLFIFLTQYLLRYLDEFLGKDLGIAVFSELIFYFSMNMVPNSLPLAILVATLMTYGNLGEHHELTAIKSSGISLVRTLIPIFLIVLGIAVGLFFFNNIIVPKVNLKAYSLLYDIRHKKPALDIKEGTFYNGLPGYSVKVSQKFPDGKSLKGVMIYNHTAQNGNTDLVLADSGYMYTFLNEKYLALELFNGKSYTEHIRYGDNSFPKEFIQNEFQKSKIVFSLASFDLKRTQEELFSTNKYMLTIAQLDKYADSLRTEYIQVKNNLFTNIQPFFTYHFAKKVNDTVSLAPYESKLKTEYSQFEKSAILNRAVNNARSIKAFTSGHIERLNAVRREGNGYEIEMHKKFSQSIACIIMFLIGAPLGAIIRKGGLGIPIFVGISFFIISYVMSMMGEKWSKESVIVVRYGMWISNVVLLPMGLFFLRQAKNDARLFDPDAYTAFFAKISRIFKRPGDKSL